MYLSKWWQYLVLGILVVCLSVSALVGVAIAFTYPSLPSIAALADYRPKLPLQIYSEDGFLIGEFGEEHRAYIKIEDVPQNMKDAIIAIEDRHFYQHHGIDFEGVMRAIVSNLQGGRKEGASTITMQVARNFFLSSERSYRRKFNEALLAIKIERNLSKDKILELYLNQIYLGQRAFGVAAASEVYYGKPLNKLTLAETAVLAGLPKSPAGYNPINNQTRALRRQREVLRDMHRYNFINDDVYAEALKQKLDFKSIKRPEDLDASYVAEVVRSDLYDKYQDQIYNSGLKVYTTIRKATQEAANIAVREGILNYDLRHGYRGPEKLIDVVTLQAHDNQNSLDTELEDIDIFNGYIPAIITAISAKSVSVHIKGGLDSDITGQGLSLVTKTLNEKNPNKRLLKIGAVIRVMKNGNNWRIVQLPQVESALIALDPNDGEVLAMVGGFDFNYTKFNHVTQAWRQPGSSFKPFIYSAALEKGYTPATVVEDSPLSLSVKETGDKEWSPHDYENMFEGPMRLRVALDKSVNIVAIRVLQSIGIKYAQNYITRFGFEARDIPAYPSMALGAGAVTPWKMAEAYAVFANGGYHIKPNLISKILDQNGKIVFENKFDHAQNDAHRVIDVRNAFIMNSMLQSVIKNGTAMKALELRRHDLAGKTGTTNDHYDAWFAGYSPKQVAVAWVGFDKPQTLGRGETGATVALPIWIKYMAKTLINVPETTMAMPDGVMSINIDPNTGLRDLQGVNEYFYDENLPSESEISSTPPDANDYLSSAIKQAQHLL